MEDKKAYEDPPLSKSVSYDVAMGNLKDDVEDLEDELDTLKRAVTTLLNAKFSFNESGYDYPAWVQCLECRAVAGVKTALEHADGCKIKPIADAMGEWDIDGEGE